MSFFLHKATKCWGWGVKGKCNRKRKRETSKMKRVGLKDWKKTNFLFQSTNGLNCAVAGRKPLRS